jgi:hypothetical protein
MNFDLQHPSFVDGQGWYVATVHGANEPAYYLHTDGNLYPSVAETPSSKGWYLCRTDAEKARENYYAVNNKVDGVDERVISQPLFLKW